MKILFVCTGNICRSPLAEGILKDKLSKLSINAFIDSCGFESFHVGDHPDNRALTVAQKRGIDISGHSARLFTNADFDNFDRIYAMDSSHYKRLKKIARNDGDRKKIDFIMNTIYPGQNIPVPDPWYDDLDAFENVYDMLEPACERIASDLFQKPGK
jgi:protein-tyrosine phosphatase